MIPRHPRRWWILGVLCLSLVAATLDNTVLNVAIPHLIADLGLSAGQTQWAVDAYSLVFAGLLLTAGSLSDRFGRKKGLLAGLLVFGGASLGAAFAGSADSLIVWRGLMGVGGAFLMPGTLSILVQVFDDDERPRAIGIWGGASALGVALGPVLGGLLVSHFWWGSVFLINVPGALLATAGMAALVWAVVSAPEYGWLSGRVLGAATAGIVALGAFAAWERHTPTPMLDLSMLRSRLFAGASSVGVLLMFALAGTTFILTQYLQFQLGFDPLGAGLRTLPVALAIAMTAPVGPRLAGRIGEGAAVGVGLMVLAAGMAVLGLSAPLLAAARSGFDTDMERGLLIGALVALAAAFVGWRALQPRRARLAVAVGG